MHATRQESDYGRREEVSLPMWNGFTTFNIVVHHFACAVETRDYTFLM